jgi:hypothetical protein
MQTNSNLNDIAGGLSSEAPSGDKNNQVNPGQLPISVVVKNTTDSVADVQLFGANKNLYDLDKDKLRGVFIESGVPGVTYKEILISSVCNPFRIGSLYMYVVSGDVKKCFKYAGVLQHRTMDINGCTKTSPQAFAVDPDHLSDHIWTKETDMFIDQNAEINFKLPPCSEIIIRMYPSEVLNMPPPMPYGI